MTQGREVNVDLLEVFDPLLSCLFFPYSLTVLLSHSHHFSGLDKMSGRPVTVKDKHHSDLGFYCNEEFESNPAKCQRE